MILHLESHYSIIANFFAIVGFYKSECVGGFGLFAKFSLHMTYVIPNVSVLSPI